MNRNSNLIEKRLLSRCRTYEKDSKTLEILEKRYSATGDQKNFLVLKPTEGLTKNERKKKLRSLLHELKGSSLGGFKTTKKTTRDEFKLFIQSNLALQKDLEHRLRACNSKVENLKGFNKLLKMEDFMVLNNLWNDYINNLISISKSQLSQGEISLVLSKISSADLIGSFLTVKASKNVNVVGKSGIVIWESQHNFMIVVPRENDWKLDLQIPQVDSKQAGIDWSVKEKIGGLRIIPKKNTIFQMLVSSLDDPIEFDIIGSRFNIKSYDRANKKFKNHNVDDIM